ncbi:hypothetical protein [Candidatus Amarolinea dominans]|uniref:hypothetical protein n=1 Tax=Candidatus Amarolinea dominans TaxID=3140696 RepID=UPI0031364FE4|nr:hypothetical protein [Anaerolineae bacterium]
MATNLAFTIPAGKVVMALPRLDLMSKLGLLKAGDMVDLLVSVNVGIAPVAASWQRSVLTESDHHGHRHAAD